MANTTTNQTAALRRVHRVANSLDSVFKVPLIPVRFGWDTVLGLLPIAGDSAALLLGLYIPFEAYKHRMPRMLVARMIVNLLIDWLLGLIPLFDIVLDTAYRANTRNAKLYELHTRTRPPKG